MSRSAKVELLAAAEGLLATPYHSPLTTHRSPLTTHHSPLTPHHSPLTSHLSPLTTNRSPLTTRHQGFLSTSPGASLHMGHLWGTAADADAELAAEAEAAAAAAAAGAYRHVEYTVYEEVADDEQSSEDARISLAELKPLEQAVRTAHAEVRNLGARSRSTAPLPPPYRPLAGVGHRRTGTRPSPYHLLLPWRPRSHRRVRYN